jgi:hypothetical protein
MIKVSTHGADFSHQMLRFGGEYSKSPMKPPQGEKRRRKNERQRGGRKRKG